MIRAAGKIPSGTFFADLLNYNYIHMIRYRYCHILHKAAPLLLSLVLFPFAAAQADWLQFNGNPQHDGNNREEKVLTRKNVDRLAPVYQVSLPGIVDGCPVYLKGVSTGKGKKDLLFLTTKEGHIMAIDAAGGDQVWMRIHPAGSCRVNRGYFRCYTTASPAVDPDRNYVYAYGLDGYVHRHRTGDGAEIKGKGWPAPATLKPYDEKCSSNLAVAKGADGTGYLYAVHAGYPGDRGNYQGHLTAINLSNGSRQVFNAVCSASRGHFSPTRAGRTCEARQAGIWGRAGVVYDRDLDLIFLSTGNGPFQPARNNWGNSVIALKPVGTGTGGRPLGSYTPANQAELSRQDLDLGSSSPVILPVPAGCRIKHLGLIIGKDSLLRLLDLGALSGRREPGHTGGEIGKPSPIPQNGQVLTTPAVWVNPADGKAWVFIATGKGICGLTVMADKAGNPSLKRQWSLKQGGTSPIVANGILFYAASHRIRALNPLNGKKLWSDTSIGSVHWQSPVVADGNLYIADNYGQLTAYELNPSH